MSAGQDDPTVSVTVIIPTRNRRNQLLRTLDALNAQNFDHSQLEVIVVADGCSDDTVSMLGTYAATYRLVVLPQPGGGAAQARNAGAAAATGTILLFIDDDVEPMPSLVAAHAARHAATPDAVVLGPYPPLPCASPCVFRLLTRQFWTRHFAALAEPGHVFTYYDILTGNLSLSTRLWRQIGGLDERFRSAREDYEFGLRILVAGIEVIFEPEATAWHHEHETTSLRSALERAYEEGRMDSLLAEKHPNIVSSLPLAWIGGPGRQVLERAIFSFGRFLDPITRAALLLLPVLDHTGLCGGYAKVFSEMRRYWYVRGLSAHFASWKEWWRTVQVAELPPTIVAIDLREGLDAAASILDGLRPITAELRYASHPIGILERRVGAEPWRGSHLKAYLLRHARPAFLEALALEGDIVDGCPLELADLRLALSTSTRSLPKPDSFNIWAEQQEQWSRSLDTTSSPMRSEAASSRNLETKQNNIPTLKM